MASHLFWPYVGILLIRTLRSNLIEILIEIQIFSFKKTNLKITSAKWQTFCLGLNVLIKPAADNKHTAKA